MKTSFISAYNLEALAQTNGTHEITVNTSKEFYALHDYLVFTLGWDCYEYAHVSQDGSVTINIRVSNNQSESTNPDNTPTTMNANETTATEFSELSHATQCLDIYLHNTAEIYDRYTVPAIAAVVEAVRLNGWQLPKDEAIKNLTFWASWQPGTKKALQAAARLVRKYDHLTPTAQDIEQVTRNYAAYIVDCAKYEIEK